jgi:hypothetical protein
MEYQEPYPYEIGIMEKGMDPDPYDQPCPPIPQGVDSKEE